MNMTIPHWNTPEAGYSKAQMERIPGFLLWLEQSELKLARELRDAGKHTRQLHCSEREMKALEDSILDERDSLSAAERDLQILGKAVAWMNQTGATALPQPRLIHHFQLPKSPLDFSLCRALERTRAWLNLEAIGSQKQPIIPQSSWSSFPRFCTGDYGTKAASFSLRGACLSRTKRFRLPDLV